MGFGVPVQRPDDVARRSIVMSGGKLVYALKTNLTHPLDISVRDGVIHVGCTTITEEAWLELKRTVDLCRLAPQSYYKS